MSNTPNLKIYEPDTASEPLLVIPGRLVDEMKNTSEAHRKRIEEYADNAFKDHVLECKVDDDVAQVWYCGRPGGSSVYHFYVAFIPHAVVVYGDIGDMLIRPGWNRGLGWLRGALHDGKDKYFNYMLGKVPGKHARMEFRSGDVIESLVECVKDDESFIEETQNILDDWAEQIVFTSEGLEQAWHEAARRDLDYDGELVYGFTDFDSEMYWCAYALRWFVREWVKQNG
ncbi:hypothetical protein LCGC14_2029010 [marine sediment metagenome]|uniref:Uncharacterized protein n=1 Tax=marine sediment metagenome TaxID=412755 RepID=A0A0F9H8N3_9ZZZZ